MLCSYLQSHATKQNAGIAVANDNLLELHTMINARI